MGAASCQSENISLARRGRGRRTDDDLLEIHRLHRTLQLRASCHLFYMIRAHSTKEIGLILKSFLQILIKIWMVTIYFMTNWRKQLSVNTLLMVAKHTSSAKNVKIHLCFAQNRKNLVIFAVSKSRDHP